MYGINYLACVVVAFIGLMLGWFWYSEGVFGTKWMKLSNIKKSKKKPSAGEMLPPMFGNLICQFLMAVVFSFLLSSLGWSGVGYALVLGLVLWIGFVGTILMNTVFWEQKPISLYLINAGYHLVMILIMAFIIGIW